MAHDEALLDILDAELMQQWRLEETIEVQQLGLDLWPLSVEGPGRQRRIAQLHAARPLPDHSAIEAAAAAVDTHFGPGTAWHDAHAGDPKAARALRAAQAPLTAMDLEVYDAVEVHPRRLAELRSCVTGPDPGLVAGTRLAMELRVHNGRAVSLKTEPAALDSPTLDCMKTRADGWRFPSELTGPADIAIVFVAS